MSETTEIAVVLPTDLPITGWPSGAPSRSNWIVKLLISAWSTTFCAKSSVSECTLRREDLPMFIVKSSILWVFAIILNSNCYYI